MAAVGKGERGRTSESVREQLAEALGSGDPFLVGEGGERRGTGRGVALEEDREDQKNWEDRDSGSAGPFF